MKSAFQSKGQPAPLILDPNYFKFIADVVNSELSSARELSLSDIDPNFQWSVQ
jgi:hypothetical protein